MKPENAAAAGSPAPAEPIYVFGSSMQGGHRDGSAATAARFHGAEHGVWRGPSGNAFAIPFRNPDGRLLPLAEIGRHVASLRQYAASKPGLALRVAHFGCGRGEYLDRDLAPLFARMPENCALPALWRRELEPGRPERVLLVDPEGKLRDSDWQETLLAQLAVRLPSTATANLEFVSTGGARNLIAADAAARRVGCPHRIFAENPAYYGRAAAQAAEMAAVWAATQVLTICNPDQTANPSLMRLLAHAAREGLACVELSAPGQRR
jgi:hypothetical protein